MGFSAQESEASADRMAKRITTLRVFDDEAGRVNRSLQDIHGQLLLIPQITLSASLRTGTRPSFHTAATPAAARELFQGFVRTVRAIHPNASTGTFQASMTVTLENYGQVTFVLEED